MSYASQPPFVALGECKDTPHHYHRPLGFLPTLFSFLDSHRYLSYMFVSPHSFTILCFNAPASVFLNPVTTISLNTGDLSFARDFPGLNEQTSETFLPKRRFRPRIDIP